MSERIPGVAVLVEDDGPVEVLTPHQPGRHNALDPTGGQELLTALRDASRDERFWAVVPTGARGSSCAGGDIRSMTPVPEESAARTEVVAGIVGAIVRGPEPVLVAVEGVAFGLGMSLAAACGHVVAARDARFGCAFARIGLIPDAGPLWSLPARVGPGTAKRPLRFADVLDSDECGRSRSGRRPLRARIRTAGSGTAGPGGSPKELRSPSSRASGSWRSGPRNSTPYSPRRYGHSRNCRPARTSPRAAARSWPAALRGSPDLPRRGGHAVGGAGHSTDTPGTAGTTRSRRNLWRGPAFLPGP
ncbi:enoyl-CoA hydratase/isomerase family protein [Streptomyces sp. NPDC050287]|uniref:enoyl-CoA hydratase/isomerase family protein n=1 Tax=Streptomyces sp. NPDC050287 TaxID=3365608 RepID=UPI0037A1D61E